MNVYAEIYLAALQKMLQTMTCTLADRKPVDFPTGITEACRLIQEQTGTGKKLMFIGNGASAAISSHMATDFWKNGGMRALSFNDGSLLTCIGNDYGYEHSFEKPVEMFADQGDVLIAISSSGQSANILLGCQAARKKRCFLVTLSGFQPGNPLRQLGDCNFFVPSQAYGPVEIVHQAILHLILDANLNTNLS